LGSVNAVKASGGLSADEAPAPAELARAQELSTAFRWVSKRTLPAIVSIRSVRKVTQPQQAMADPFDGSPFGRQFGGTPFEDLFGDLRERMRQQQGQGGGSPGIATGEGSGFIIDSKGVVMTNAHVVRGADEVIVSLADGTDYKATDVRSDEFADVAVVRIKPDKALPTIPLGDDAQVEIGQHCDSGDHQCQVPRSEESAVSTGVSADGCGHQSREQWWPAGEHAGRGDWDQHGH
jgi:serine protease Do